MSYKFTPVATLPPRQSTYIVLDLPPNMALEFDAGRYVPASDEIGGSYWNGDRWVYWLNGTEYEDKGITHWMALPSNEVTG